MFTMHIYLLLKTSAFCRCRFHSVGHRLSVFRTSCVWSWSFIITITENDTAAFSSTCKCRKFLCNLRKETKWCLVCKFFFLLSSSQTTSWLEKNWKAAVLVSCLLHRMLAGASWQFPCKLPSLTVSEPKCFGVQYELQAGSSVRQQSIITLLEFS